MKRTHALCTVLSLTGCAWVPTLQAPGAGGYEVTVREAQLDASPAASRGPSKLLSAARQMTESLAAARVRRIEISKSAIAADAQVAAAREKVLYLWALLPQRERGTCSNVPTLPRCRADAEALSAQFEQAIREGDATYDEPQALSLYAASRVNAAACMAPEFECLVATFDGFGGNSDTKRSVTDALKSLEQREQLVIETGIQAALPCLNAGEQQYRTFIARDYQMFSHEPQLASQLQLHRDYHALYEAQVECLETSGRTHRTAGNY